ncbi:MAG: hypothetical protein JWM64_2386, partial [Frankiales bacterium]|nr:hypothetical protein [Frankiales bacterium]
FTDTPDPVTGRGRYDNYTDPTRPKDKTDTALSPWEFDYSCLTLTVLSMSGNVANNDKLPFEAGADVLTGRVHLTGGPGCATLDTRSVVPTTASPSASPSVSPSATAAAPGSSATPAASPSASSSPTPAAPGGGGVPAPSSSPTASGSPSPSAPASAGPTGSASAPAPAATTVCGVPAPVQVARSTIVSGDAVTAQLTGSPGALVDLVAYTRPSTTYRTVRSVRLAGDGTATARLLPPSNTRMYAQERGCAAGPSSVVTVKASVSLDARRTGPRTYAFSGNSLPKRAGGMPVLLYRRDAGGREVLVSRTRTDGRTGTWTLRRTFTGTGRLALVARIPQDASNAAGVSAVRTVTVR